MNAHTTPSLSRDRSRKKGVQLTESLSVSASVLIGLITNQAHFDLHWRCKSYLELPPDIMIDPVKSR